MGFLKGMRDLQDLSQHHGGMPSIRGAFSDIGKLADDRGQNEVLKKGVPAKGFVKGFPEQVPGVVRFERLRRRAAHSHRHHRARPPAHAR